MADGYDALILADYCRALSAAGKPGLLHIARDAGKREELETLLAFFAPDITVLSLPAWDCLPYDRVGPGQTVMSQRMSTLASLANLKENNTLIFCLQASMLFCKSFQPEALSRSKVFQRVSAIV